MAFVRINKGAVGPRAPSSTRSLRMSSNLQSEKQSSRTVGLFMSKSLVDDLGWTAYATPEGTRSVLYIFVDEGTEDDAGFWMLTEGKEGDDLAYRMGTSKEHSYTYGLSLTTPRIKHYVLNELPAPLCDVEYSIDDKALILQCPDWLRYNPLSVPEKPKPEATVHDIKPRRTTTRGR